LRGFLDNEGDIDLQLIALSALLEPWQFIDSTSVLATQFLFAVCSISVITNFQLQVRRALSAFMPDSHVVFRLVGTTVFSTPCPFTLSHGLWDAFAVGAKVDPMVRVLCEQSREIHRIAKLVKLFRFMRAFTPTFAFRLPVLFIILNCASFAGSDAVLLWNLPCAAKAFEDTFRSENPFIPGDFPGCNTAYEQLCYAQAEIIKFQDLFLNDFIREYREVSIVPCRFTEFLPQMSVASMSLSRLCFAAVGEVDLFANLRNGFPPDRHPFARLVNERSDYPNRPDLAGDERPDFFGMCESDWRYGFSVVTGPLEGRMKTLSAQDDDTPAGRIYHFMITLLYIVDPEFEASIYQSSALDFAGHMLRDLTKHKELYLRIRTDDDFRFLRSVLPPSIGSRIERH
jgi:hypothetical protein